MEDDNNLCEICLEAFNISHKIPKILDCCKTSFCLSCLKDIYRTNRDQLICPICRKITNKNPVDLKIHKEKLEPCLTCPTCHKGTTHTELRILVSQKKLSTIVCAKCSSDNISDNLSEYLLNVADEMDFYINSFCNFKGEAFENIIDFQLNDCVDNILQPIIKKLKNRIKSRIMNEICEGYELKTDENNFSNIFQQFSQFKENFESLVKINKASIRNEDYYFIKSYVDYYINNSEKIKNNGIGLKKIYEYFSNSFIVSFNKMVVDYDDLENILERFFEVKVKAAGDVRALKNNKFSFGFGDNFTTGVKFIDEKFSQIKKENENLYENFLKGDLQIKKLERELENIKKNSSIEKINSQSIDNSNVNDVEFKIINSMAMCKNSQFEIKNFLIQNFNFSINPKRLNNTSINSCSSTINVNNYTNINSLEAIKSENKIKINTLDDLEKKLFDLDHID